MPADPNLWNARGSEWHRWDPHLHAPGTALNDQFKGDWPAYLKAIDASTPGICALGITDYCSIATYRRVIEEKQKGNLPGVSLIFPNVELRLGIKTEKGRGLNLHLLFSPDDPKHAEEIERILAQLTFEHNERGYHCSKADLIALGKAYDAKIRDDGPAFAAGVNQFKADLSELRGLFRREAWLRENCLVAVAAGEGDGTAA